MLREAKVNDYLGIYKVATDDLGYKCEPKLVKYRLKILTQTVKRFM